MIIIKMNNLQRFIISLNRHYSRCNFHPRCLSEALYINNPCITPHRFLSTNDTRSFINLKSLARKVLSRFSFFNVSKSRLRVIAYLLFESIADHIKYEEVFSLLKMPDTFYSWFVITELHIWMLMARYMGEGDKGLCVRNYIVEALWADVDQRVKKLGEANRSAVRMQVQELADQLRAAIVAYDEGLQSTDVILAGALWRRFYQQGHVDPESLDILVKFVRKQMKSLDNLTNEELFNNVSIKWESIKV